MLIVICHVFRKVTVLESPVDESTGRSLGESLVASLAAQTD
jgi:hypothetical protein